MKLATKSTEVLKGANICPNICMRIYTSGPYIPHFDIYSVTSSVVYVFEKYSKRKSNSSEKSIINIFLYLFNIEILC